MRKNKSAFGCCLRNHAKDNNEILSLLKAECPRDTFSLKMWRLGLKFYREKLRDIVPVGSKILDIGCGTGTWSIAVANIAHEVTGIDMSAIRISAANKIITKLELANVQFRLGDIFSLNEAENQYDIVICYNTLQYVENYDDVLREIYRILKPNGGVYCSVADRGILLYYLQEALYEFKPIKFAYLLKILICKFITTHAYPDSGKINSFNGIYLKDSIFCKELSEVGFIRDFYFTADFNANILYPKRLFGIPCFNEYFFRKPADKHEGRCLG